MSINVENRMRLAEKFNLMSESQREFLLSHIKATNPRNIIEVGVYAGGATYFMYEATRESKANILSVDILNTHGSMTTGFIMDGISDPRIRKEYGKDASEVCEIFDESGEKFDFLVLDTAHIHPIESLNFLTILPYLTIDATIILHDIELFTRKQNKMACKLLFDTVTAEKSEPTENVDYCFSNIGAFKINEDTRKYIRDVFSMLRFSWGMYPAKLSKIWSVFKHNYDAECLTLFKSAFVYNAHILSESKGENLLLKILLNANNIKNKLTEFDRMYFWGAGKNTLCKELIDLFHMLDFPLPFEVWDTNYQNFGNDAMLDFTPIQPEPENLRKNDCVIITVNNHFAAKQIISNIAIYDCNNFFEINDLVNF